MPDFGRAARSVRPHAQPIGRRCLLVAATASLVIPPGHRPGWIATLRDRVAALNGPGLLRSYDIDENASPFDRSHANCAYTYDNAVAGMALLAANETATARRLADALVAAQSRDRFWTDGRLRNAYAAGPTPMAGHYPLPGWWDQKSARWVEDPYQVSTATGVVAWAMLFWAAMSRATGDERYAAAAGRAADWVQRSVRVKAGYSGGFYGWEPSPARLGWVSTEHNLDLAVAFGALNRVEPAIHARDFYAAMWDGAQGRFYSGLTPSGAINPHSAADANLWPLLAPGAAPAWAPTLDWVLTRQGVPAGAPEGVDFNTDRDGIWLEGTAYAVLAARRAGRADTAARFMATLRAQTAPSGLVWAASVPRLTTGLSTGATDSADFFYYRRPHVGATGWAALAALNRSPFA